MSTDEIRHSANRRVRAYRCRHCRNQGKDGYVRERFRVESHVYKHHVSLDKVPFSCTICLFRCTQFRKHLKSYAWHRQRGGSLDDSAMDGLMKSVNPYLVDSHDMEMLGKEESVSFFMGHSRRREVSPEGHEIGVMTDSGKRGRDVEVKDANRKRGRYSEEKDDRRKRLTEERSRDSGNRKGYGRDNVRRWDRYKNEKR